ncbi:MAG: sigma-70 family RNA polymerase sigma factor [Clostridia bacterium]|nr:sigma-70 family RNA polymerase sigma factor [Clostridia bacterium]
MSRSHAEHLRNTSSAFDIIYNQNCAFLEKAALRYMKGDVYNCEELLQELWIFVAERAENLCFNTERAERAYLLTVLRNLSRDMWKALRVRARRNIPLEDTDVEFPDVSPGVEESVSEADVLARVGAAIRSMKPSDRDVLTLILYNGCTVREAADALGCSEDAANSQYYRARKRLSEKLRKEGIVYDENYR